jgi:hypothetical protein
MSNPLPPSSWRDPILAQFTPEIASVARLTVVADPDELLTEQGVVGGIRERGFEIVPFEDQVSFRYAYERRFRQVWDAGKATNLVVVLRAPRSDISELPFDLLHEAQRDGRLLSFSLAEMFHLWHLTCFPSSTARISMRCLLRSNFLRLSLWVRMLHEIFSCEISFVSIPRKSKPMRICCARF